MSMWQKKDGGEACVGRTCGLTVATAAGTGDATEQAGAIIDLNALGNPGWMKVVLTAESVLQAAKTLKVASDVDHGADSGLSDTAVFDAGVTVALLGTGPSGGGTVIGQAEYEVNLSGAKQYLRVNCTPELDASGTDTCILACSAIFGGFANIPVSEEA